MTLESDITVDDAPVESFFSLPPIAGFWRRLAAWVVDSLFLGIIGQILGWSLISFWFNVGPYGRFVGLLFILVYFGLMNSKIGKGQTLGKRFFNIAVRDRDNKPIGAGRSFFRILILAIPFILNGWALPFFEIPVFQWLISVIIFGFGTAILYTMVFNRKTRQGIHDLLSKTYVVYLKGTPIESFPRSSRIHWIVSGVLIGLAIIVTTAGSIISSNLMSQSTFTQMYGLQQILETDNRYFTVGVSYNSFYSSQSTTSHSLNVQVWYIGVPSNEEVVPLFTEIATLALDNIDNIDQYDSLRITINSAYDLGIASGHVSVSDSEPIETWRDRISDP